MRTTYRYVVRIGDTDFRYDSIEAANRKFEQSCEDDPGGDIMLLRECIETGKEEFLA